MNFLEKAKFDDKGLLTAIAQDAKTGKVLMCAFMNEEALKLTVETQKMTYWSRSRQKLWVKGESSGNTQKVIELRFDCDGDALVCKIEQVSGACHEGWESCFAYKIVDGEIVTDEVKMFDPQDVY